MTDEKTAFGNLVQNCKLAINSLGKAENEDEDARTAGSVGSFLPHFIFVHLSHFPQAKLQINFWADPQALQRDVK